MKRHVSFLLAMLMLVSLIGTEWTIADAIIPGEDTMTAEEKVYCNATLEDDFAPDRVLVVLTNAASTSLKTYSLADFTGYGFKNVTKLKEIVIDSVYIPYVGVTSKFATMCSSGGIVNAYQSLHDHTFVIGSVTASQHQRICSCGIVLTSQHLFQTETLYLPGGQIQIIEVCSVCGYQC